MDESLEEMVRSVVARHLDVPLDEIDADLHVRLDLHLDPLDLVLIALRLEDMELREFPIHRLEFVDTVRDIARVVQTMRDGGFADDVPFTLDIPRASTVGPSHPVSVYVPARHAGQRAKRARRLARARGAFAESCGRVSSRSR